MPENQSVIRQPRTSRRFNLISATMAFVLWGSWAYFVNSNITEEEGFASPFYSALAQGTGSFIITLVMVHSVTWLYLHLPYRSIELILPALITVLVTGSCLATLHQLVGTPHIVETIAPGLSVAFAFNVYTTLKLRNARYNKEANRTITKECLDE